MPCMTYTSEELLSEAQQSIRFLDAIACAAWSRLTEEQINAIDWNEVGIKQKDALNWWSDHKESDRTRRLAEREAARRADYERDVRRYEVMSNLIVLCSRVHHAVAEGHRLDEKTENHLEWSPVYHKVFDKLGTRIRSEAAAYDIQFPDYYNPDTTYKDDILAFDEACIKFEVQLRSQMAELEERHGF